MSKNNWGDDKLVQDAIEFKEAQKVFMINSAKASDPIKSLYVSLCVARESSGRPLDSDHMVQLLRTAYKIEKIYNEYNEKFSKEHNG